MTWTHHPDLLATPVPRYTSYPTAAEFHERVGRAQMEQALDEVAADASLSLYVHIPYCREICWYCGCNTGAANRAHRLAAHLDALHQEVELVSARLAGRGRVGRVAFGGGSPNAISAEAFSRLVAHLSAAFGSAPLSVELDPRDLRPGWIAAAARAGMERASMGVQTLAPHVQAAIGRIQPEATVRAAMEELRAHGVASINFDLMYGLPGQSHGDLEASLAAAAEMGAERIALFGYAHVPHLIPRQRRIDAAALPGPEERFAQAAFGYEFLTARGYEPVGFDHFALTRDPLAAAARTGRLRRDFQGFTDDPADIVIGFGASAISQFPDRLLQNEKNAGRYRMLVSAGRLPAARGTMRSEDDRCRGAVIEGLLCRGEADVAGLCLGTLLRRLAPFRERGLVEVSGTRLRLARHALPYARAIAAIFDAHRQPERRFSSAV